MTNTKRLIALITLLLLISSALLILMQGTARAEGSKDLVSQGGARAYLDYRETTNTIGGIARRSTIYVYAQQGERIWLGSSANGVANGRILYTPPNTTTASTCATTSGVISNLAQEQAGPNATGGFTPCSVTVGSGQAGIWKIEFSSPSPAATNNPPATAVGATWTQPNNVGYVSAWDVTVRNSGNTASIPGRVYANYLALITGANGLSFNPDFFVQTRDGFRYRLDPNGLDPNGFVFFANNKGFRDANGNPLYRSVQLPNVASLPSGVTLQNPGAADTASDVTHKLFINTPASDLPDSANITGGTTWLVNSPEAPPSVSNLTFTGSEGTANQAAPGAGGTFTFQSGANSTYRIVLDLNRDGTFGNGNDRVLIGSSSQGTNSVLWDGKDGTGANVTAGGGSISASVTVYAGEIHFPIIDAENNPNGTIIQRLIPSTDYTVYYDDTGLTGDNPPSPLQNLGGESSQNGSHEWGNTSATAYGNEKGIDTWAYGNGRTVTLATNIQIRSADLEVVTNTDNQTTTKSGNQISYTVTVRNNGPSDVTGANFSDNVPTGINNVSWTCAVTTGTGSCGTASGTGNSVGSLLNLNSGAVATFIITGTVAADAPATLSNLATITRPNDVSDSNENNNRATDTTTVNRAPVAQNKTYSTDEDTNLSVNAANGLLNGATDADGNTLTPSIVNGPTNGTINLNADGSFTYNPNANFNGTDTFTYRVCDNGTPQACSENRTVTLTVNSVNDPPTATNDNRSTNEDTPLTFAASTLTTNDSPGPANESGQTLTVTSVQGAQNGTVALNNGQVTFTPNANFSGAASFTYTISDGQGGTATGTVNVTVNPVNDAPDAVDDARTTNEDTPVDINVLTNDTDVENNTLTVASITQPANGAATIITSGANAGQVRYTPNANFSGTDTFTYTINDGNGGIDTATVTVTVSPVNDAPVNTVPGAQTTNEDNALVFSAANGNRVSIADPDAGNSPVRVTVSVPQNTGTLTLSQTSGLTFTTGDGTADRTMTFTGTAANINAALAGLRFDPATNYSGPAPLTIVTNDQGNTGSGGALEDTDTVAITVNAVNDAPTLSAIQDQSTNEDTATARIPFTFSDIETANANLTITATSSNTNLVPNGNIAITRDNANGSGYLVITPAADQTGTTTITLTIRDADGGVTTRTFVVTVNPVNDPPQIDLNGPANAETGYTGTFTENGGAVFAANATAATTTDVDNANLQSMTVTLTNRPDGNATESLSADVSGTPITASYNQNTGVLNLTGSATVAQYQQVLRTVRYNNTSENPDTAQRTITFVDNDGTANSNTATATINVVRANDAPDAVDNSYSVNEDATLTVNAPGILANDTDVDGDTLTVADADGNAANGISPVTGVRNGTLTLRADGSFTYVPDANYFGTDSFVYRISDGNGGTDEATVNITVDPVNDDPVLTSDTRTIAEDQTLEFPAAELTQNDSAGSNEGNQTLTVTSVQGAQNGTVRLDNGRVVFTPNTNFNGAASFTYTVSDGQGGTATETVTVNVTAVNDLPEAANDTATTDEDTAVLIDVRRNDTAGPANENNQTLTLDVITARPANGTAEIVNGQIRYTPNQNFNGTDTFEYRVCDSGEPSRCDEATVSVTVNPVNDAPVAEDDTYEIAEDQTLTANGQNGNPPGLLANDTDVDNDNLTVVDADPDTAGIQPVNGPTQGTLTLNANGTFTYVPNANFNGQDTFRYRISDGNGGTSEAVATISADPINDPPEATNDSYSMNEDTTLEVAAPGIIENDTDGDNDTLVVADADPDTDGIQPVTGVRNGTLTLREDGSFTYVPNADYFGTDSFVYLVSDGNGGTDEATVDITISPVNDAPVAQPNSRTIPEDQTLDFPAAELTQNDSPGAGEGNQTLTVTRVFDATDGQVRLDDNGTPDDRTDDRVVFIPDADYFGQASFSYEVCDDGNPVLCDISQVNVVDVTPVNDPPTADDDEITTDEDQSINIDVLENDTVGPVNERDGQTLTLDEITSQPENGTAEIVDGQIRYTPNPGFNGTDTLMYRVCDDGNPRRCDTAMVTITVDAINDAPVNTVPEAQTTSEDTPLVFSAANGNRISTADVDVDNGNVRVTVSVPQAAGTLTANAENGVEISGNGTNSVTLVGSIDDINRAINGLRFDPAANFDGAATLTILTNDLGNTGRGGELTDEDTVEISVEAVNDAPTLSQIDDATTDEDTDTDPIEFTFDDIETDNADLTFEVTSSNTNLVPNANIQINRDDPNGTGTLVITPAENQTGTTTITVTVRDGNGGVTTRTFVVTVNAINDAPENAVPEPQTTDEDTPLVFSAANGNQISVSDVDAAPNDVTVTLSVAQGTLTLGSSEDVEVTGDGTDSVTITGTLANVNLAIEGLTYDAPANASGTVTLTILTNDNGNTGRGGELTDEDTVEISVEAVNDAPTFDLTENPNRSVDEDANPQEVPNFATNISAGDNEPGQNVRFEVTNDNNDLFTAGGQPAIAPNGTLTYTPAPNAFGTTTVTVVAIDDNGSPDDPTDDLRGQERTFTITIRPVNDEPTISNITDRTVDEDQGTGGIPFTIGDVETAAGELTVTATSSNTNLVPNGNIQITGEGENRVISVTPNPNRDGTTTITVTVRDAQGAETTETFVLTVRPVNDAPTAEPDTRETNEDTPLEISAASLLANDSAGPDNEADQNLSITSVGDATNGTVRLANGTVVFTPAENFNGEATFRYIISDGNGGTATTTVTVNIAPRNDAPAIDLNGDGDGTGYTGTFDEDGNPVPAAGANSLTVADVDDENLVSATIRLVNDPDGAAESIAVDTAGTGLSASYDPQTGVLTVTGDAPKSVYQQVLRTVTYANDSQNPTAGERRVTFTVNDGDLESSVAEAIITVIATDDPPVITLPGDAVEYTENGDPIAIDADATVADPDTRNFGGGRLTVALSDSAEENDRLTVAGAGDISVDGDTVIYEDTPIGTLSGGQGATPLRINFNENATREAVEALIRAIAFASVSEDPSDAPRTVAFRLDDGEGNISETVTAQVGVVPVNDAPNVDLNGSGNGTGFNGTFTEDGGSVPAAGANSLTVADVDDANIERATVTLTNRPDGNDVESLSVTTNGSGITAEYDRATGVLTLTGSAPKSAYQQVLRTVRYDNTSQNPDTAQRTITYVVNDGDLGSDTATATIAVQRANDAPDATNNAYSVNEDATLEVAAPGILENDTDGDNDTLVVADADPNTDGIQPVTGVRHGTLTLRANGSFTYVPDANYFGTDSFTYRISDGNGGTDEATVNIAVDPINDDPTARNDAQSVPEDAEATEVDVLANDSANPDRGETLTVTAVTQPANNAGTVEIIRGGEALSFTPNRNFTGDATFTYTISDGNGGTATATVTVTVGGENDAPEISDFGGEVTFTENGSPVRISPDASLTDVDSPDFDGGRLTVALSDNAEGSDRISIRNQGTGAGQIGFADGIVTFGGTRIGTVSGGEGDDALVINFNENATREAVEAMIENITFASISEDPSDVPRRVSFTVTDGDGGSDTATKTITVVPVPDAPVIRLTQAPDSANEGDTLTFEFAVEDVDSDAFTVANGSPSCGTGGALVEGSLTVNASGGSFRCSFPDGLANPTVSIQVEDPQGIQSNTASQRIEVANVAPTTGADGPYDATEDTTLEVGAEDGVLYNDRDAGDDSLVAELVQATPADAGELTLNPDGSFTFVPADGFNGTTRFIYRACEEGSDPRVCSEPRTVVISVGSVNDAPNAADDEKTTREDTATTLDVISNDTDPDGQGDLDAGSIRVTAQPENGSAASAGEGRITYTPNRNFNGTDTFTYEICDVSGECDQATVTITVTPVNDAPIARNDRAMTPEDTELRIAQSELLANDDPGPDNESAQNLRIVAVGNADNGTVRLADDGDVVFTPAPGYNGPATFNYTVRDDAGNEDTATATVNVTISPVNDEPTGDPDTATTDEDESVLIDVTGNDTDPDGDVLSIEDGSLTQPENGRVEVADGQVRYTPNQNFNGQDTFTYRVSDGNGGVSAPITVTVTVEPANDDPTGNRDSYAIQEDATLEIQAPGVLENDSDADGDELTVELVDDVTNGTLDLNGNGSFTYTPDENFVGTDTFTYRVSDGNGGESAPITVTITVGGENDAPNATDDSVTTDEDSPVSINVLANDTDPENDDLSIRSVGTPQHGRAVVRNGEIFYTPNRDYNGQDTFTYTVVDASGATDTATVTITITPVNDPPNAENDDKVTQEDTPLVFPATDLLANDDNGDGGANGVGLTVVSVQNAQNGTVSLDNGVVTFAPAPNYSGPASFTYTVRDGAGNTSTATAFINVTVNPVNDAPEAINDEADVDEDESVEIDVTGNDTDPENELDPSSVTVMVEPENGTATVNADGTITYTPNQNFNGQDTFTYEVCDSGDPEECDTATVNIDVAAVNDAPVAVNDEDEVPENGTIEIDVTDNDTDVDGDETLDPNRVEVTANPQNGTAAVNADGTITYRPNRGYNGPDSLTYEVCDEDGACDTAEVSITVGLVNDAPTAADDTADAEEDGSPVFIDVLQNDEDPDNDTLSVTSVTQPQQGRGTVEIVPAGQPNAGQLRYTPDTDYNGQVTFTYTVSDGNGGTATATVTITVGETNDDPTAADDSAEAREGGQPVEIDVLENDGSEPDTGETLTISEFTQPPAGEGTVALAGGVLVYTPDANFDGETAFTYTISDGNGGTATATVTVTVVGENDPVIASNDEREMAEDAVLEFPATSLTQNDVAGDAGQILRVTQIGQPQHGTVRLENGVITYRPSPNYNGSDSFTYTVCDDGTPEECDTARVNITIGPVNDAPTADNEDVTTAQGEAVTVDVLDGDTPGPDNESSQILGLRSVTEPGNGTARIVNGRIVYTSDPGYSGSDSFNYTVCDNGTPEKCATATVTVAVEAAPPTNEAPNARNDVRTTAFGEPITVDVLANDGDDSALDRSSLTIETQPRNGVVVVNDDGTVRYAPNSGFSGRDTFTYRVCDNGDPALCDVATVIITVEDAPPVPVADLGVRVSAPGRVVLGKNFPYTLTVSNRGPDTAQNVVLTTKLPKSVRFVSAPKGCKYDKATRIVTCRLGNMENGDTEKTRIIVKAVKAGKVTLQGCTVESRTEDPNGSNDSLGGSTSTQQRSTAFQGQSPVTTVVSPSNGDR